jgi:competence protein ComEA
MSRSVAINLAMLLPVFGLAVWIGWPEAPPADKRFESSSPLPRAERFKAATHGPTALQPAPKAARLPPAHRALDLNRSTVAELQELPGVGEMLAQRIVAYRAAHGPFRTVEDLREVKGIGAKRLEQLQQLVTVESDRKKPS